VKSALRQKSGSGGLTENMSDARLSGLILGGTVSPYIVVLSGFRLMASDRRVSRCGSKPQHD